MTNIGDCAFEGCSGLVNVIWNAENCTKVGSYSSIYSNGKYNYNDDHTIFKGCYKLTDITIGDNVKNIPNYAFYGCSGLTSVKIGKSVTGIGDYVFYGCNGLANIYITDLVAWCNISEIYNLMRYGFYNKNLYLNGELVTDLVIPDEVTSIAPFGFSAFSKLASITMSDNVTSIGSRAFLGCSGLTRVTIGEGITRIGYEAFYGIGGLVSVIIPESVTSIEGDAFRCCSKLSSIEFKGTKEQWNNIAKNGSWNLETGNYTIHCIDGDIAKS